MYAATPTMRFDRLINLDVQASVMKDMAVDDREGKVEVYASGGRDRAIGVMRRSLLAYVGTFRPPLIKNQYKRPARIVPTAIVQSFMEKNVTTTAFRDCMLPLTSAIWWYSSCVILSRLIRCPSTFILCVPEPSLFDKEVRSWNSSVLLKWSSHSTTGWPTPRRRWMTWRASAFPTRTFGWARTPPTIVACLRSARYHYRIGSGRSPL